jgi:hypothetical protein
VLTVNVELPGHAAQTSNATTEARIPSRIAQRRRRRIIEDLLNAATGAARSSERYFRAAASLPTRSIRARLGGFRRLGHRNADADVVAARIVSGPASVFVDGVDADAVKQVALLLRPVD